MDVVIVGGGLSGALFGLKLHRAHPDWRIAVIEPRRKLGRGVAYGACGPNHLLNVPVSRMEVGLTPGFADWLGTRRGELADALVESGLDLASAFVPRRLFGDYIEERVADALSTRGRNGLSAIRGEAVRLLEDGRGVLLTDGRSITADIVVLAMGNLPPRAPGGPDRWLYDTGFFIPDPWAADAFADIDPDEALLLIGSGLTMVDVALRLTQDGHRGPILAVSRRGLMPRRHLAGGAWRAFLNGQGPASPLALLRLFRAEVAEAQMQGVPWQRVFDAARPAVATIWNAWSDRERRSFLRHLRPRWDVHRHRTAPRVADGIEALLKTGRLEITAGRIAGAYEAGTGVVMSLSTRAGERTFMAGHVINCTGPGADFGRIAIPLIAHLREQGLAVADPLCIGFETRDCAVIDADGQPSSWLFALGPLTRPAWWEIVAVPEINLQIDRLVAQLGTGISAPRLTPADFFDMGEGI